VEVAAKLSRDGQGEAAATHLDRLGSVIREAHADVREFILDLRSTPSCNSPSSPSCINTWMFHNNYDIKTQLTFGPELMTERFRQMHSYKFFGSFRKRSRTPANTAALATSR